jgi:hypothetical protein
MSNYPPGVTQRMIDAIYGPDLSDAAEAGLTAHAEIQAHIAALRTALTANADHMLVEDTYSDLMAALEDATMKPAQVEDLIYQEEADRAEDALAEWADRRYDERRDREMGL